MAEPFVRVAVALPVSGTYTYAVPPPLELCFGQAILVPFGRQTVSGYVIDTLSAQKAQEELGGVVARPVTSLLDPKPVLDKKQLQFFTWAADYYLAGLGHVISTALPSTYRAKRRRLFYPAEDGVEAIAAATPPKEPLATILREVIAKPGCTEAGLARRLIQECEKSAVKSGLVRLRKLGWVQIEERDGSRPKALIATIALTPTGKTTDATQVRGARMQGVMARLIEASGTMDVSQMVALEGPGARSALTRLVKKGLVIKGQREDRTAFSVDAPLPPPTASPTPTKEQQEALDRIIASTDDTFLLHGVTGSGKTEVYLQAAAHALQKGRQVLVLVPEISLTPQLTQRFRARFGEQVAVLHSGLTPTDRLKEWRRIRALEAQVAVGARSALFAPFQDLGLIVVDEEHDDSYKQDDGVRYNARDLAVVKGRLSKCPVVLGSATPSFESWKNASDGRYETLMLTTRPTPSPMPSIELLDIRGRPADEALSPPLVQALQTALDNGGKAIVLFNRRGFAPVVECPGCGASYECPSCGVGMVYHQRRGRLTCHYCGFYRHFQKECPSCGDEFQMLGHGTERVEQALHDCFPTVGIARMDADTTTARGSHQKILERFQRGDARILVGTQIVAKGHDFPDVHLAAVVGVDNVLTLPDFRSAERTFSLVTQLAGRAGRGDQPGRVLVQTRHMEHFVFRLLADADRSPTAFYEKEARQRQILSIPPFARLVLVRVEGANRTASFQHARELADKLRAQTNSQQDGIRIFGPTAAPISKMVGRWRFQIVIRGFRSSEFRTWLQSSIPNTVRPKSAVRVSIDVDPRSLL